MQLYILKDLNDDTKLKAEYRSSPNGTICRMDISLLGRAWRIVDAPVLDPNGLEMYDADGVVLTEKRAELDSTAEAQRLSDVIHKEEQNKLDNMRRTRDSLLISTDYVMMSDYPLNDKTDYEVYRQQLRDLPSTIEDIDNITWPTKP